MGVCSSGYVTLPQDDGKCTTNNMYSESHPSTITRHGNEFRPRIWQRVLAFENIFADGRLAVLKLTEGVVLPYTDCEDHGRVLIQFDHRCDDCSAPLLVSSSSIHFEQLAWGAQGKRRLAEAIRVTTGSKALKLAAESLQREYIDVDSASQEVQRRLEAEKEVHQAIKRRDKDDLRRLLRVYHGRHVDLEDVKQALED
jgi:hypothetical protein